MRQTVRCKEPASGYDQAECLFYGSGKVGGGEAAIKGFVKSDDFAKYREVCVYSGTVDGLNSIA